MDDNVTCASRRHLTWMVGVTSACDVTTTDIASSLIGLTAGPIWLLGHFLTMSARTASSKKGRLPAWVTWSLLPHCLADVISCAGAVLAAQLFPQVFFAVVVLSCHVAVAMVIILRSLLFSRTEYDLRGESLVKTDCTVSMCGKCPLKLGTLCVSTLLATFVCVGLSSDVTWKNVDVIMTTRDAAFRKINTSHGIRVPVDVALCSDDVKRARVKSLAAATELAAAAYSAINIPNVACTNRFPNETAATSSTTANHKQLTASPARIVCEKSTSIVPEFQL